MSVIEITWVQRKYVKVFLLDLFTLIYLMSKPDIVCQCPKDLLKILEPLL